MGHLSEAVQDYFGSGNSLDVRLTYAVEDAPLGTAGAVKNAQRYLGGTFAVLNGDIFVDFDIAEMLAFHRRQQAKATISLTWVDNPSAFGVVETDNARRVRRFIEKPSPDQVTTHWINAGIYILELEVLDHVPANGFYMFEKGLFPLLLKLGEPVYGYPISGYWLDMGTLSKYLQLNCDLLQLEATSVLIGGLGRDEVRCGEGAAIHPSAQIVGPVLIGSGCSIGPEVQITGPVVIGSDCYIRGGTRIEKAVLWRGVSVGAGATIEGCIITGHTDDGG